MKVIRVNCEQRNEYGSDLHGEYKARNRGLCLKNRRPWRMTKPLYLHKASLVLLQVIFFCPAWGTFRHGFLKIKRTTPLSWNEWVLHQIYSQKHLGLTLKKFTVVNTDAFKKAQFSLCLNYILQQSLGQRQPHFLFVLNYLLSSQYFIITQ